MRWSQATSERIHAVYPERRPLMASTTVRLLALPTWVARLRNWLIDDRYMGLEWNTDLPEPSIRYWLHERIESLGQLLLCAIFRRESLSENDLAALRSLLAVAEQRAEDHSPTPIH